MTIRRLRVRCQALAVFILLTASSACNGKRATIRANLDAGSSIRSISWTLVTIDGKSALVSLIRVARGGVTDRSSASGGNTIWTAAPIGGGSKPLPQTLQYGVTPPGFTGTPAIGLAPGPYRLEIVSGGVSSISYFEVKNDGSVS